MKKISTACASIWRKSAGLSCVAAALAAIFLLGWCSKPNPERLQVLIRAHSLPDTVIEKFEAEYNARVICEEFYSNDEMHSGIMAGSSGYDIVFASADFVPYMIEQNMLEKIDKSKIANMKNLDPDVLAKAGNGMEYSVPYCYGAAGIAVNTASVPNFERSWKIFERADLRSRMAILYDMREAMGGALISLGYSVNTKSLGEIQSAAELIFNSWRRNITRLDSEGLCKGYAAGAYWVVQGYAEAIFKEIADNPQLIKDTVFFIPDEGAPSYIENMCILKGARNLDLAHKFIDFIHRPEIYAEIVDGLGLPSAANIPARQFKTGGSWYKAEDLAATELKGYLGEELNLYNEAWFGLVRPEGR